MKFDFVIGNPPYQASTTNNRMEPIYQHFYESAEMIASRYLLITPARFLFNAGLTPKEWNNKMLNDEHLKVEYFNQNASEIFSNTDIKGGVAVIYRDSTKKFGAIHQFIPNNNLRSLFTKFSGDTHQSIESIICGGRSDLKFNNLCLKTYPTIKKDRLKAIQSKSTKKITELAPNEEFELKSSAFEVLPYIFKDEKPQDISSYYRILGWTDAKRTYRWIEKKYMTPRYEKNNLQCYKVFIPKASGKGELGEILGTPVIGEPNDSATPTFIGIGQFATYTEAENASKYLKTKFARILLGILKITQDVVASKFKFVPIQDFSINSDIDWTKSVTEIDNQLYSKYNLTEDEIKFIETTAKEMK